MAAFDVGTVTKPADADAVPKLIQEINQLAGDDWTKGGAEAREALKKNARDLLLALETPRETMIRQTWADPGALTAINVGVHKGIWKYLVDNETAEPFKTAEVAKVHNIDPPLLCRFFKHLAAMGYLKEASRDTYHLTNLTRSFSVPIIGDSYPCMLHGCLAACNNFTKWADKNDWKTPSGPTNGPLQLAYNTELNFFEHLQNAGVGQQFNSLMGGYHQGRASWMDNNFYPVQENLLDGFDKDNKDAALLVDIGGNVGHDLEEFGRKHPDAPGRLILQDLPVIIGQIGKLDSRIERQEYDFYTEQPVKGARAYFMHSVLHDWSDEICLKILANITAAMKPGYSKLLINENIIQDTGASWEHTCLDMMMVTLLASKERTRADWEALLGSAGLKITGAYTVAPNAESLIEAELI